MALEGVDHLVRVREAVEVGSEAVTLDDLDGDSCSFGTLGRGARTVDHHDDGGEIGVEEGLEDGARPGCQDPDPHHASTYLLEPRPTRSIRARSGVRTTGTVPVL